MKNPPLSATHVDHSGETQVLFKWNRRVCWAVFSHCCVVPVLVGDACAAVDCDWQRLLSAEMQKLVFYRMMYPLVCPYSCIYGYVRFCMHAYVCSDKSKPLVIAYSAFFFCHCPCLLSGRNVWPTPDVVLMSWDICAALSCHVCSFRATQPPPLLELPPHNHT